MLPAGAACDAAHPCGYPLLCADGLCGAGLPEGAVTFVVGTDQAIANGALDTGSHQLSELIGRPTTTLAEYVRRVL